MHNLTSQNIKSIFMTCVRTLFHAVFEFSACDFKLATTEKHLLITRSNEYRQKS